MNKNPIGIFDSGMGGISVLAEAKKQLPSENFIYFGDNAFAPYGTKEPHAIQERCVFICNLLIQKGCKAIVIACNTATSVAGKHLRELYSIPIVGMEPALKPAYLKHPEESIAVLATPLTLQLEKFQNLMQLYGKNTYPVPCPELVKFIENNTANKEELNTYLMQQIQQNMPNAPSAIVLGCTHFIFIKNILQTLYPHCDIVDGHYGTVQQLQRKLQEHTALACNNDSPYLEMLSSDSAVITLDRMQYLLHCALKGKDYTD